jgi:hypothetical protein
MAGWAEYLGFLLLGRIEVWRGPYLAITGPPPLVVIATLVPKSPRELPGGCRQFGP